MTTDFTVAPIIEEQVAPITVDLPSAVGGEPSRAGRIIRGVEQASAIAVGDLRESWIWHGKPPSIGDIVKVRVPDWEPFEALRHHCFDRTEGMREIAPGGWSCECTPLTDAKVRKSYTRQIQIINAVRLAWIIYNHVVAIPASLALYIAAWIIQHPGRLLLTGIVTGIVLAVMFG